MAALSFTPRRTNPCRWRTGRTDLQAYGGAQVAKAMALGGVERSPADIAVAVTGVAGPEPDEDGNPVGLIFISARRDGRA